MSSGRPLPTSWAASLFNSSSRSLRRFLFAWPGTSFFIPLLPDLLLPSSLLGLEFVLCPVVDLSRFIDATEPLNWSARLPTTSCTSEERRLPEKTFLMLLKGGEAMGDTTGEDWAERFAMMALQVEGSGVLAGFVDTFETWKTCAVLMSRY